jgi:hypothetical protein
MDDNTMDTMINNIIAELQAGRMPDAFERLYRGPAQPAAPSYPTPAYTMSGAT